MPAQHIHRSGPLKQQNKTHKTGRHRSKSQLENEKKGRTEVKSITKRGKRDLKRQDRRNRMNQLRKQKREETMNRKRSLGEAHSPPFLTAIVSLDDSSEPEAVLRVLLTADETGTVSCSDRNISFLNFPRYKQRFSFIVPPSDAIFRVLDALKVADTVMFVWPSDGILSSANEILLSCIMAQGLLNYVNVVQGWAAITGKKKEQCKKSLMTTLANWSLDTKIVNCDSPTDGLALLRQIGQSAKRVLSIQKCRSHLIVESTSVTESTNENPSQCTLNVCGYVRGPALSANDLIHIPGCGTYQMSQIDLLPDPRPLFTRNKKMEDMEEEGVVLEKPDPANQQSLQSEAEVDPMAGEQTWPTDEELKEAEKKRYKKVPAGTSEYQASWIVDEEECGESGESSDSEESEEDDGEPMDEAMEDSDQGDHADDADETTTIASTAPGELDERKYDMGIDMDEEKAALLKFRKERENEMFPDEVDTPLDVLAHVRFQRYRGLQSFRTSPWDPKENLPSDYARIFQFENFKRTKKRVLDPVKEGATHGSYVRIHIDAVPKAFVDELDPFAPFVVYGLVAHEQKMTVLNMVIQKHSTCQSSIKSKDKLLFQVGYRRFYASPIFSQHTAGDKHKYERFLPSNTALVASIYAPVVFPPAPVLVFQQTPDGDGQLVAVGSVMNADPDRIVVKRIVLSGHPFRIRKRSAVVRYMFFNRGDILWFKPVELKTKCGRRGHIKEPLGTHGHMKCVFNAPVNSQDTVLMNLYKRVFPKWTYEEGDGRTLRR